MIAIALLNVVNLLFLAFAQNKWWRIMHILAAIGGIAVLIRGLI